jgi:hypothetical protein
MKRIYTVFFLLLVPLFCFAQSFGFSDEEDEGESKASSLPFELTFGGEIEAGPILFVNDFKGGENTEHISYWDFIEAKVNFDISGKNAQAFIGLNLNHAAFEELIEGISGVYTPALIDEMWLKGYFDRFSVKAGLVKLRWGRMYSPGPLDIVNPVDYSELTNLTNSKAMKIARPMVHASYRVGELSEIEAVFLPNFAGHKFDEKGRWEPDQYANIESVFMQGVQDRATQRGPAYLYGLGMFIASIGGSIVIPHEFPNTATPDFYQAGLRFNTVIGSCDLGFQYFYGYFLRPSVSLNGVDDFISAPSLATVPSPHIEYSSYHQMGIDYSQVLAGFTVRAEAAVHLTEDLSGDNGNVKNPFIAWALGFDRDLFAGINLNVQCNESIRLYDDKVIKNPALDCEGADDLTSTRLILQLAKSFFRDRLECKVVNIWDIEDGGLVFIPSIAWTVNDTRLELSAGIFTGDKTSELGQYRDNSYVKLKVGYSF